MSAAYVLLVALGGIVVAYILAAWLLARRDIRRTVAPEATPIGELVRRVEILSPQDGDILVFQTNNPERILSHKFNEQLNSLCKARGIHLVLMTMPEGPGLKVVRLPKEEPK